MRFEALKRLRHWALVVALAATVAAMATSARGDDFVRGDMNQDGSTDIGDALALLFFLVEGDGFGCDDAADVNDDGSINIGDPVYLLHAAFSPTPPPFLPPTTCGADSTPDSLDCDTFNACP